MKRYKQSLLVRFHTKHNLTVQPVSLSRTGEKALQRGDEIILATKPINKSDLFSSTGQLKGMFAEEIKFLVQNNFKPINLTIQEWSNIKTWFQ